jgi:hypothetical protein
MRWFTVAGVACGALFGGAASAHAEEGESGAVERRRFDDRPVTFGAVIGFGTLVGEAGITVGYELDDRLAVGAGIGSNFEGWMGGPYLRMRPVVGMERTGRRLHAFSVDVGLSIGPYDDSFSIPTSGIHQDLDEPSRQLGHDTVAWLQLEPSWETKSASGTTVRLGTGWAVLLTPEAVGCEGPLEGDPCGDPTPVTAVVTFSMGFAVGG